MRKMPNCTAVAAVGVPTGCDGKLMGLGVRVAVAPLYALPEMLITLLPATPRELFSTVSVTEVVNPVAWSG